MMLLKQRTGRPEVYCPIIDQMGSISPLLPDFDFFAKNLVSVTLLGSTGGFPSGPEKQHTRFESRWKGNATNCDLIDDRLG